MLGFVEEAAEFATGVVAGSAFSSILRAGASGLIRGLKGGMFEKLFGGTRAKTEEAKAEDLAKAPKDLAKAIENASGDAKLGQLAQEHLTNTIAIQVSGRSEADKAKAIEDEKARYKAAINEYLLGKSKQSIQNMMAELADIDADAVRIAAKNFRTAGRETYRGDFFQWLFNELSPSQREIVLARRDKITTARIITDMLDFSENFAERFQYLSFTLGDPDWKGTLNELARAAMHGCLEDHPAYVALNEASSRNVASREDQAELIERGFRNRRNI
ncbi:MAG: hypothetical protein PHS79_04855 [Patescibacteria group bacterium]|nr:hypothetical protein [Patescibacteria group bacterium]